MNPKLLAELDILRALAQTNGLTEAEKYLSKSIKEGKGDGSTTGQARLRG